MRHAWRAGPFQRHYCVDCAPRARPYDAEMVAAATTTGIGASVFAWQPTVGALLLVVGTVRMAARLVIGLRRRARPAPRPDPGLALNPRIHKITVTERLTGTACFTDDCRCDTRVARAVGVVEVDGAWSRTHRAVLDAYRRRKGEAPAAVDAGHLVLQGAGRVAFPGPNADVDGTAPTLRLRPPVADQPVLSGPAGHGNSRWRPEFDYDVATPDDGWALPVWVAPGVAPRSDWRVLELDVQWSTRGRKRNAVGVPLRSLTELRIAVPAQWGDVEYASPLGDVTIGPAVPDGAEGIARRTITWSKVPFDRAGDLGTHRFLVRFTDRIDLDHQLTGRIEARFAGALSGLDRVVLYRTDGGAAPVSARRPTTSVVADLELSLKGLRYQEHRAVPDRSKVEDAERTENELFQDVVPDHRTVALLTDSLADEGYYIKRVVENPPQPGLRAGMINRFWDVAGRYYDGVYPIDFHVVLTGEELHKGLRVTGDTDVRLTVHGSYANDEMERRVVEEWTRLWRRIRVSIGGAVHGPGGGPRVPEQPIDASSVELARLRNLMVSVIARIRDAAGTGEITPAFAAELTTQLTREFGLEDP